MTIEFVFSSFCKIITSLSTLLVQMLNILENYMKAQKYKYLRLDGTNSIGGRHVLVKKFNEVNYFSSHDTH